MGFKSRTCVSLGLSRSLLEVGNPDYFTSRKFFRSVGPECCSFAFTSAHPSIQQSLPQSRVRLPEGWGSERFRPGNNGSREENLIASRVAGTRR